MDWKQNKKKIICNEIGIIIVLVIIILLGITINIFANNGLFLKTENMENISSVLLQIQGTLITITIAVVAILSGVINESYMGISISSYYLEKRPFVLKYKFIIVLEFVLLTAIVIFHFISLYYVVFAIFVVTLIFIVASIFEVFEFFKGTKGTTDEIERYVEYRLEKGNDYLKYGNQFLIDWKKDSANQSTEEYEKHLKMFFKLIDRLLYLEDIKNVNSLSEKVSLFLLRDYSKANQLKGLLFICEYYKHICDWIDDNPEKASNINEQIHLIDKVYKKWYSVFSSYDPETIENVVNFRRLSENVIRVAASIGYDENISKSEPHAVYGLAGILGHYIKMQLRKGEAFDLAKWGYILYDYYSCFISGIPEKTKDFYSESLAIRDFNICKGYLLNEQINLP